MVFSNNFFAQTVLSMCRELTREQEKTYLAKILKFVDCKPIHVGVG